MSEPKDAILSVRCRPGTREAFIEKAKRFGGHNWVLRELIDAFIEDRVRVEKPANDPKEEFYVD